MPEHRFVVGQLVRLKSHFGTSSRTSEMFQITGKLPAKDSFPQYRMRNDSERHERVTTEDMLEEIAQILPVAHRQSS